MMSEDRRLRVLRAIVQDYVETSEPVGSKALLERHHLGVSAATVRNDMAALEEEGLIAAPHTSAGRMPTEPGLRLFVDGMMHELEPSAEEQATIAANAGRGGPVEAALAQTTAALSGLSSCAGMVLVPKRELVLRQVSFVPLSADQALAVMVGEDGTVENRVVAVPAGVTPGALAEAANYMSARLAGLTLAQAQARLLHNTALPRVLRQPPLKAGVPAPVPVPVPVRVPVPAAICTACEQVQRCGAECTEQECKNITRAPRPARLRGGLNRTRAARHHDRRRMDADARGQPHRSRLRPQIRRKQAQPGSPRLRARGAA